MTWNQWFRLCKAKGYRLDVLQEEIGRKGFSRASLSKIGKRNEPADPELVAIAWKLQLRGPEDDFEMYWQWLARKGVEVPPELRAKLLNPPSPGVDPYGIVNDLMPKLESIFADGRRKVEAVLAGIVGKVDATAASLRGKFDGVEMKLKTVETSIEHFDAKLDVVAIDLKKSSYKAIRTVWAAAVCVLLGVSVIVLMLGRSQAPSERAELNRESARTIAALAENNRALTAANSHLTRVLEHLVVQSPTGRTDHFLGKLASGTNEMGEKAPPEKWIPKQPLPGQLRAPDCNPATGEETINGGCWAGPFANVKPPCGELFRHGDGCYRPVAADPQKPMSERP